MLELRPRPLGTLARSRQTRCQLDRRAPASGHGALGGHPAPLPPRGVGGASATQAVEVLAASPAALTTTARALFISLGESLPRPRFARL